jgi:hypothetical protein
MFTPRPSQSHPVTRVERLDRTTTIGVHRRTQRLSGARDREIS